MKEINLEEILWKVFNPDINDCVTPREDLQLEITLNPSLDRITLAMKEACNQALDLAAGNAKCTISDEVDSESILQIKDWIK